MNVHPSGVIGELLESRFSMSVLSPVAAVEFFEFEDSFASRDGGRLPGIDVRFQRSGDTDQLTAWGQCRWEMPSSWRCEAVVRNFPVVVRSWAANVSSRRN